MCIPRISKKALARLARAGSALGQNPDLNLVSFERRYEEKILLNAIFLGDFQYLSCLFVWFQPRAPNFKICKINVRDVACAGSAPGFVIINHHSLQSCFSYTFWLASCLERGSESSQRYHLSFVAVTEELCHRLKCDSNWTCSAENPKDHRLRNRSSCRPDCEFDFRRKLCRGQQKLVYGILCARNCSARSRAIFVLAPRNLFYVVILVNKISANLN